MSPSVSVTPSREATWAASNWESVPLNVPRCDRWSISRRLQDLDITCSCPLDGTLRVNVNHALDVLLVYSTLKQFTLPRREAADWLERCWATQVHCRVNH